MTDFSNRAGEVTLLVIRNNGDTFNYVNGGSSMKYFDDLHWNFIRPLMKKGFYYVLPCVKPKDKRSKKLIPFGIALELESQQEARNISFEHVKAVNEGTWNAKEEFEQLKKDCVNFSIRFFHAYYNSYKPSISRQMEKEVEFTFNHYTKQLEDHIDKL